MKSKLAIDLRNSCLPNRMSDHEHEGEVLQQHISQSTQDVANCKPRSHGRQTIRVSKESPESNHPARESLSNNGKCLSHAILVTSRNACKQAVVD
jgi:hypothetical protein